MGDRRIGDAMVDAAEADGGTIDEPADGVGIGGIDPLGMEPLRMHAGEMVEGRGTRSGKGGHAVAAIQQPFDDGEPQAA